MKGLSNNTKIACYFNSLVQTLFYLDDFNSLVSSYASENTETEYEKKHPAPT